MNLRRTERRKRAAQRLEAQLASNYKPRKGGGRATTLTADDRHRIGAELATLERRVAYGHGPRPWSTIVRPDPADEMAERLHNG